MTDIVFVYNDRSAHSGYSVGLGIASISAFVGRHGFTRELVYRRTDSPLEDVVRRIRHADPLAVGFYGPSSGFSAVAALSREIRRAVPDLFQVYGGPHATLEPGVLAATPWLDAICVGYGERPVLELLTRLRSGHDVGDIPGLWVRRRDGGRPPIEENPPWDWDDEVDEILGFDYPLFLRELARLPGFDRDTFNLGIMLTRGCPYDCAFCSNRALRKAHGGRIFRPSPAAALRVLREALSDSGLRRVEFHDEILTADKGWFREFMAGYRSDVAVPFWCNLRAGAFDEDDVRTLVAAGVQRVFVGLESGNDVVRNEVMNKRLSREELTRSLELLHRHGVPVTTQNMIGLPHETPQRFLDTVRLNARLRADSAILSVFYPYPGTRLEQLCRREGLLPERPAAMVRERTDTVLELPEFPRRTMLFYQKHFTGFLEYERRRERSPWLVPLTTATARPIGMALDARRMVRRALRPRGVRGSAEL